LCERTNSFDYPQHFAIIIIAIVCTALVAFFCRLLQIMVKNV
jgi:hypothetical protein